MRSLLFFLVLPLLDRHILELARLEYLATFLAFNVFGIFISGDNLYLRMLAEFTADFLFSGLRGLDRHHMHSEIASVFEKGDGRQFREIGGILGRAGPDVKSPKEARLVTSRPSRLMSTEVSYAALRRTIFRRAVNHLLH
ncbi:MAG: hypothetical protein ACLPOA_15320 [Methylocella sp.]